MDGAAAVFVPPGAPRRIRFRAPFGPMGFFCLLFGGIWSVVGWSLALGFLLAGRPFWDDWILAKRSQPGVARPIDVRPTGSSVNRRRVQEIRFRFRDAQGAEREAKSWTIDPDLVARARAGDALMIDYDPEEPSRVRIAGTRVAFFGAWPLLPLAFGLVGTTILVAGARGILRRRRLLIWGEPARGRVVSVKPTGMTVNRRRVLEVRYSFAGPFGPVEAKSRDLEAPPEGTEVTVLYDPRDPEKSVLPDADVFV